MKKNLLNHFLVVITVISLTGNLFAQHEAPVKTLVVPPIHALDLVLDGLATECSWGAINLIDSKFNTIGVSSDVDFSGYFQVCWDWSNLHIFINITDDIENSFSYTGEVNLYDCIEIYLDLDTAITNSDGTYTGDEAQIRFNRSCDTITGTAPRNNTKCEFKSLNTASGWTLEIDIPWLVFFPDSSQSDAIHDWFDKAMGFDIIIVDNDGTGRDGQFTWDADDTTGGITENKAWKDTRVFGTMHLAGCIEGCYDHCSESNTYHSDKEFKVYPNPTSNEVRFDNLEGVTKIEFINLLGKIEKIEQADAENLSINVSDLATGQYFIKLYSSEGVVIDRILIE